MTESHEVAPQVAAHGGVPAPASVPPGAPVDLFSATIRAHADLVLDLASPDAWVRLDVATGYVESMDADELLASLPSAVSLDLDGDVRVCLVLDRWVLLASYATAEDAPEAPLAYRWHAPSTPCPFPSLRSAPGLDPPNCGALVAWALAHGDVQARVSALLAVECMWGMGHMPGRVAELWLSLDCRGLASLMDQLDDEHRAAVGWALALREGFGGARAGERHLAAA